MIRFARPALVVVVLLVAALTALVVAASPEPLAVDSGIHTWMLEHRNPTLTDWAVALTRTGIGPIAYALAALAGGLAGYLRRWRRWWLGPVVAMAGLLGAQVLRQGLARLVDRPRPPMADWAFTASGPSFPSGHTTTSATVAALFCLAVAGVERAAPFRRALVVLVLLWAGSVGVTRVYLGVHWPTDVLGGWLLGTAFALTAVLITRYLSARRSLAPSELPEPS